MSRVKMCSGCCSTHLTSGSRDRALHVPALAGCEDLNLDLRKCILHPMVVGCYRHEIVPKAKSACYVDGVERADVDRAHIACFRHDVSAQRHNRSGRENALQNYAAIDHRIGTFLASTRYRSRQLDFGYDARRELAPSQQLSLDHPRLGLADKQLQQRGGVYIKDA